MGKECLAGPLNSGDVWVTRQLGADSHRYWAPDSFQAGSYGRN